MTTPRPARLEPALNSMLVSVKLLHTAIWFVVAACIVALPVAGALDSFGWAAVLTGVVLLECGVLAANRGVCPLTNVAARYTEPLAPNFDIYLPVWLARYNKTIFGALFVVGGVFAFWRWWTS
jgi:hypothetical protein